jgi:hypothetical protein
MSGARLVGYPCWVMSGNLDLSALRDLRPAERQELLRELVDIERESVPQPGTSWKWDALLVVIAFSCMVLAAWVGYLAVVLPHYYRTGSWRGAWVGFDVGLLAAFAGVGWAAWRRRQLLILALGVLATLLTCDAWFDVVLDLHTSGFWESLASALGLELPVALLAILMARRLLHMTIGQIMRYEGIEGPIPALWRIPLLGPEDTGTALQRLRAARARRRTGPSGAPPGGQQSGEPQGAS